MRKISGPKLLAIMASIIVGLSIVVAISLIDPPEVQRKRRLDARRVHDLASISYSIDLYWERKKTLPPDLSALEREPGLRPPLKDPKTGLVYWYEITTPKSYKLCAEFAFDSSDEAQEYRLTRKWSHGSGKQCFDLQPPTKPKKDND